MATYRVMKSKLPSTLQSMSLYLANRDTEFILFKPVRVGIRHSLLSQTLFLPDNGFGTHPQDKNKKVSV